MDKKKIGIIVAILVAIIVAIILFFVLKPDKEETLYEVTFKNDTISNVVEVKENDTVSKPSDPIKEGYTFEGWYYNGMKFDFTTKITGNITLEARWTDNNLTKYTVTFNTDGGNIIDSLNVEEGKAIIDVPTPTKEGYKFLGWYLNDVRFNFNTKITKDIELIAKWEEEEKQPENIETITTYTVTFDSQGGNKVASQKVEKNKIVTKPEDPIQEGYKFLGWYLNNKEYNFNAKVTKNIVLTAKWEKVETKPETPSEPEKPSEPEMPSEPEVKKYTVTFDSQGGNTIASQEIEDSKFATKPTDPKKDGHKFLGWYLNDQKYDFDTKVTKDIKLIAKWEKEVVVTYKIEATDSYVGQVIIYVLEDGKKVDGLVDITTSSNKVAKDVVIPKDGYVTNGDIIKQVSNVRVK